jgi:hypothetical protein
VLLVALMAYATVRRAPRIALRVRTATRLGRVAYVVHLALGALACGAVLAHVGTGRLGTDAGGALALAMACALATGALGAALQALVPRRLARLERNVVLPEELSARADELDERLFSHLSGKNELVKTLYARLLRPYRLSRVGVAALVLTGRTLRDEERHLRARVDALLVGPTSDDPRSASKGRPKPRAQLAEKTRGIDELVRVVVEHRAVRAQRVLAAVVRGWVPLHVAAAAVSLALLVAHVVAVVRR